MFAKTKVKEKSIELKATCAICAKEISDKPQSGFGGWLFANKFCSCLQRDPEKCEPGNLETESQADGVLPESKEVVLPDIGDKYDVLGLIGQGGMGAVYKVKNKELGREFAIKLLRSELAKDKGAAKRFAQEAKAAKDLTHANLAAVYGQGTASDGSPYMVMDYLSGGTLADEISQNGRLQVSRVMDIALQICDAIQHAHNKRILHRDLKPSNIMLTKSDNGDDVVKVVDFGIAKVLAKPGHEITTKLTQSGDLFGSPLYMSPEQCKGDRLEATSDIYSFGCLLYEALTGKAAFDADNPFKVMLKHVHETPEALGKAFKGLQLPPGLDKIILHCLEKDPRFRYQSATELKRDLELVQEGKQPRLPKHRGAKGWHEVAPAKRHVFVVSALIFVTCIASSAGLIIQSANAPGGSPAGAKSSRVEQFQGKTLAQWTKSIEKDSKNASLYYGRAELHKLRDERTNAIEDFTQAISLKADYREAYKDRAEVYTDLNQFKAALDDSNKVISMSPDWSGGYEARSYVESAIEDNDKADR